VFRWISVDGLVYATMNCQVGLAVAFQVELSDIHYT